MGKLFFKIFVVVLLVAVLATGVVGAVAFARQPTTAFDGIPFLDVHENQWYFNAVVWVYNNAIMNGINVTEFAPDMDMTRAMLVTVLWRYAGMPDAGAPAFDDVSDGRWYSTAVAWANENGIVTGHRASYFGLHEAVNREQMYTILYRYMNFAGLTVDWVGDEEEGLLRFADEHQISSWAVDAMYFMHDAGIMFMYSTMDINARPQQYAFRGEIAAAMFFFDLHTVPVSIVI